MREEIATCSYWCDSAEDCGEDQSEGWQEVVVVVRTVASLRFWAVDFETGGWHLVGEQQRVSSSRCETLLDHVCTEHNDDTR